MNLVDLPDELIILIIKELDLLSIKNLHTASDRIRDIITTYGIIKNCNISRSVMANADTLRSPFFKDVCPNLQELNLCGVYNIYKTGFLPVAKRLQCLNTLDVTYTNITISDLLQIYNACPTIKDVSINFAFGRSDLKVNEVKIKASILHQYQNMFENFVNVHFVSNLHMLMYSELPSILLKKARLKELRYSIIDCEPMHSLMKSEDTLHADSFTIYITNTKIQISSVSMSQNFSFRLGDVLSHGSLSRMALFSKLDGDKDNYEKLIILKENCLTLPKCFATPIFENFFSKYCNSHIVLNIEFSTTTCFDITLHGNVCMMLWNKETTTFDDKFFRGVWQKIKPWLPCYFDSSAQTPVSSDFNVYITIPQEIHHRPETHPKGLKKKRIVTGCTLDYDVAFQDIDNVRLLLMFENSIRSDVSLSSSSDYLQKLTFLSLSGHILYHKDFYTILFGCCDNLKTLVVKANACQSCHGVITRTLPISRSIENILLIDKGFDFPALFTSMSKCKSLANVHIMDTSDSANFSDPSIMLQNCENLYCLYLYIYSTGNAKKRFMQILKKANIRTETIVKLFMNGYLICDPYSDVFQMNLV